MKISHYMTGSLVFLAILGTSYTLAKSAPKVAADSPNHPQSTKVLATSNFQFPRFTPSQAR